MSRRTNPGTESSVICGFFNSSNGDRRYQSEEMSRLFDGLINDGVYSSIGTAFRVVPSEYANTVNVGIGKAWFNHTWTENTAELPITLPASDLAYDRYDAIIIEVNNSQRVRDNFIKYVSGTPATKPNKPGMINNIEIHQHPIAYILRKAGSSNIDKKYIDYRVGQNDCPMVTGIVKILDLATILAQYNAEFDAWFENIKGQLSGDVAGNLQNQIDGLSNDLNAYKNSNKLLRCMVDKTLWKKSGSAWVQTCTCPGMTASGIYSPPFYMKTGNTAADWDPNRQKIFNLIMSGYLVPGDGKVTITIYKDPTPNGPYELKHNFNLHFRRVE